MDDIEKEILRHEQSLAATFKAKFRLLEDALAAKDEDLRQLQKLHDELKAQFDFNLQVIRERDEDLKELQSHFEETLEVNKQKTRLMEAAERDWLDRLERLERELQAKHFDIRDLQEKLKEAKRENSFYKKGYLDEVASYKLVIAQKDADIEAFKKEIRRIKAEDIAAVENRLEEVVAQTKATFTQLVEQVREEAARQKQLDKLALDDRDSQAFKLQSELDKIKVDNIRLAGENEKLKIDNENLRQQAFVEKQREYKEFKDKEMELVKNIGITEHKFAQSQLELDKANDKIGSMKDKYSKKLKDLQTSYEEKIIDIVADYRKELTDKVRVSHAEQRARDSSSREQVCERRPHSVEPASQRR